MTSKRNDQDEIALLRRRIEVQAGIIRAWERDRDEPRYARIEIAHIEKEIERLEKDRDERLARLEKASEGTRLARRQLRKMKKQLKQLEMSHEISKLLKVQREIAALQRAAERTII